MGKGRNRRNKKGKGKEKLIHNGMQGDGVIALPARVLMTNEC